MGGDRGRPLGEGLLWNTHRHAESQPVASGERNSELEGEITPTCPGTSWPRGRTRTVFCFYQHHSLLFLQPGMMTSHKVPDLIFNNRNRCQALYCSQNIVTLLSVHLTFTSTL